MGLSCGASKPPGLELTSLPHWGRCRAQEEVKWRQQLLWQNHKLLQSLRVELKVYVKLDEEHQRLRRGTGPGDPARHIPGLRARWHRLQQEQEGRALALCPLPTCCHQTCVTLRVDVVYLKPALWPTSVR